MKDPISNVEWTDILAELDQPSERTMVIVASALLERVLAQSIILRLRPASSGQYDKLFGDRGPLGTFSNKIDLGFSLGLFGDKSKTDFHRIRKIRNEFAHHFSRTFAHPEIIAPCSLLRDYDGKAKEDAKILEIAGDAFKPTVLRWRFKSAVGFLAHGLLSENKRSLHPPAPSYLD